MLYLYKKGFSLKKNTRRKKNDSTQPLEQNHEVQFFRNRLKPKSTNQKEYIRAIAENTITFCQGLAGSGKTHIAVGMALEYLLDEKVKKIIITRPVLEAGEKIGYLPGTAEEKLHPYLLPILDEINYFVSPSFYNGLRTSNKIEIVPLGFMRGRNFHDSFIIADECQNASYEQLKMLLTRVGINSRMVLTGDVGQSDLSKHLRGGFQEMINTLDGLDSIGFCELTHSDIVRNPIIANILSRLDNYEQDRK